MKRSPRVEQLKAALAARRAADIEIERILKDLFPTGAPIEWEMFGRARVGYVTMNCHDDRVKVRNADTGREFFIHAERICGA